jgi:endonuclease YncB( thermonuclease family)
MKDPGLRASILSAVIVSMLFPVASTAATRVVDGDTLDVDGVRYRLHGVDAPEAGQRCAARGGGSWPCGAVAIKAMRELLGDGDPVCEQEGDGGYGRTLAVCRVNGLDVGRRMVEEGMAFAFRKYSLDYVADEDAARAAGVGVWQAKTETPWEYRADKWREAGEASPTKCLIKGNVTKKGRIYHTPWSPWYARTKINPSKGERWFCSEEDALKAGWRAPSWGD